MLEIKNLQASINKKQILKGLNLIIKPGELHAIMFLTPATGECHIWLPMLPSFLLSCG